MPTAIAEPVIRRTRSAGAASGPSFALEAALLWDYENMPLGKVFKEDALARLLQKCRALNLRLVESRLYADSRKLTLAARHRPGLEQYGVTLIDCPTDDKKEAVDKKIICDALFWALPRATRSTPCAIVLVSSDGDFAHMLSRLQGVGGRCVGRAKASRP